MIEFSFETSERIREKLDARMFYAEPSDILVAELPDGRYFYAPETETEAAILDRIDRSLAAGRNLFAEEWAPYITDPNAVY
ncbi:MAG: hypothetical protein ACI4O7_08145 [Aristaeellaceae bacterium]